MTLYLDYNATCPLRDSALKALVDVSKEVGNASSSHSYGRRARAHVDQARRVIQDKLEAPNTRVIFTSGATEANNLALRGLTDSIYISAVEHSAVKKAQVSPHMIPVNSEGLVDLEALAKLLDEAPARSIVSVMLVNNETGVIQPVKEVTDIARAKGHLTHTDAAQAVGKIPVSFTTLGVDMMSLSSHKFGGPMGCGVLIIREDLQLSPILRGGGHEFGMRSGTLPVPLIHAMEVALVDAVDHLKDYEKLEELRERLENAISPPGIVHGTGAPRVANTTCVSMPGIASELQLMSFDLAGVAVSVGSACSSGKVQASAVLKAMGIEDTLATQAIRVSLGYRTTSEDIDQFIGAWKTIYSHAQKTH